MDFSVALTELKLGNAVTRVGWNGADQYLKAQFPDDGSKMTKPYIYIRTVQKDLIPWLCSQGDMFANDWQIYDLDPE